MVIARSFDDKDGFEPLHTKLYLMTLILLLIMMYQRRDAYYKVYTFDKRGNYNESFVAFLQNETIPFHLLPRFGLTGDWSSSGDVTLSWESR